jgi:1-deoxy-D-xylulose-5-phosphate synthase
VIHDVCLQNIPVVFCLDRAGMVGEDGATHHGIFDISFLRCIPNLIVFAPRNEIELRNILYTAQLGLKNPITIRYPRGRGNIINWKQPFSKIEIGKGVQLKEGKSIAVLTIGTMANNVIKAVKECNSPVKVSIFDMRFIKPLDKNLLLDVFKKHTTIITVEDGVLAGGFGTAILEFSNKNNFKNSIYPLGVSDEFPNQGSIDELQDLSGISSEKITRFINSFL